MEKSEMQKPQRIRSFVESFDMTPSGVPKFGDVKDEHEPAHHPISAI